MTVWEIMAGIVGSGTIGAGIKTAIDGYNRRSVKLIEAEIKADERGDHRDDSQRVFLQGLVKTEKEDHKACIQRVQAVEAAMFRQNDAYMRDQDIARKELADCHVRNSKLQRNLDTMCGVLARSLPDGPDKDTVRSIQPVAPRVQVQEVGLDFEDKTR